MRRDQIIKNAILKSQNEEYVFIENNVVYSKKKGLPAKRIATVIKPTK